MPAYHDQSGRAAGPRTLRIRGLIVAVVVTVVALLLQQQATGHYDDTFKLTVVTDTIGEGLTPGAEVKFHGLAIGSVKTLEATGFNKQQMTVLLDPRQASTLTSDTKARFTSSNVFGSAAVELVSSGHGPPLARNQTLLMDTTEVQASSITGLLRQGQKLTAILDSPEFGHIIEELRRHGDLAEPVAKSLFNLAEILADAQTVPFSQSLSVMASFVNGVNDLVPLVPLFNDLLDRLDFLVQPGGVERTTRVLRQISDLLRGAGEIFVKNNAWLIPLVTSIVNLSAPTMFAVGSLAPAYDRLSGLLDRTSAAFPVENGKVRMNIDMMLNTMPGIAAALPGMPDPLAAQGHP